MAAVVSPLVFALAVPGVFPAADAGTRVSRPVLPQGKLLRTGKPPSPRGAKLWVNPGNPAAKALVTDRSLLPGEAMLVSKIARSPQSNWLTSWLTASTVAPYVAGKTKAASSAAAVPVFVLYNIPFRDCGLYSAGGASTNAAYRAWIRGVAKGLSGERAIVVLEPDSLAGIDCLPEAGQADRYALLNDAVNVLTANPRLSVYLDAGNARWKPADVMAPRLAKAGLGRVRGFSVNAGNFDTTANEIAYAKSINRALGAAVPFVVDTSRNGNGPWAGADVRWCNPPGRALGARPTTQHPDPLVDALLWIKTPGLSDGSCGRGLPAAGVWWRSYAVQLARNAHW
ncbi:MAG: glycoside hydrolase family 6 protein [Actinobacteria bacterium]|nr:glycoside hydrolase family 6 protein [Actinomycetota bacterium]